MRSTGPDPARLDVAAFARARASLEGRTPLARLQRLAEMAVVPADGVASDVAWSAQGLWARPAGGAPQMRLHLVARATVWLACQRCLQPAAHELAVDRTLRFVAGEDEAARLDEDSDEDVLALPRTLDLEGLIEDELILALPIVPRHEACPQPLSFNGEAATDITAADETRASPFASLARLKTGQ